MGYYTHFELDMIPYDRNIIAVLRSNNDNAEYCLEPDGSSRERGKWYGYESELAEFSKNYPDVLFILSGAGEESGDLWKLYVRNGNTQKAPARISYDPVKI